MSKFRKILDFILSKFNPIVPEPSIPDILDVTCEMSNVKSKPEYVSVYNLKARLLGKNVKAEQLYCALDFLLIIVWDKKFKTFRFQDNGYGHTKKGVRVFSPMLGREGLDNFDFATKYKIKDIDSVLIHEIVYEVLCQVDFNNLENSDYKFQVYKKAMQGLREWHTLI